jgi:hypothetical protein
VSASLLLFHSYLFHDERICATIGEGGHVRGLGEAEEVEEEEREIERKEEEVEEVGLWQREGRLRWRFKSEKLGM